MATHFCTMANAESLNYNVLSFDESASVRVENDTMNATLSINETGKSRQEVSNIVTRRLNAVLARAAKQKDFEVKTESRQTYPEYDDRRQIKSWSDSASINISSQNIAALNQFIADNQQEAAIQGISFSVSPAKHAQAVEQASTKVLHNFQQRAKNMSHALGFSNYKIVNIKLNQSFNNQSDDFDEVPVPAAMVAYRASAVHKADVMQSQAGMQEIRQTLRASVQMY